MITTASDKTGLTARIHVVPDEAFVRSDHALTYDFRSVNDHVADVVYMPHHQENFGNIGFLKLTLYCRRYRIRLSAFGHVNQLPEFSILADRAILEIGDHLLDMLYDDRVTKTTVHRDILDRVTSARFIHAHGPEMTGARHNYLLSRGNAELPSNDELTPQFLRDHDTIIAAQYEIDDDEVVDAFTWPDVYVRRSSWELFESLDLPDNIICSEAKRGWPFADRISAWLERCGCPEVREADQRFQRRLLEKVGSHYMAIQFLASWLKNWMFACVGGSANLFAVLPVKGVLMFDNWYRNTCTEPCLRELARRRYGSAGDEIPIFLPHRLQGPIEAYLDEKLPILKSAPQRLAAVGYGGSSEPADMIDFVTCRAIDA